MNHTKARKAIHAVALQSGVSVDAVMKEMEAAIAKGRRCTTPGTEAWAMCLPGRRSYARRGHSISCRLAGKK